MSSIGGCGATQPFFTDPHMDRIAIEALQSVNLLPSSPEPIRIERFVERRFNLGGVMYDDLPANVLGYTQFGRHGVEAVFVSRALADIGTRIAERRINSTLAHESGHGLLHAHLFTLDSFPLELFGRGDVTSVRILCRDESSNEASQRHYDGRWWEFQANRMIGCLLMPKPLVLTAIEPHLSSSGSLGVPMLPNTDRERVARVLTDVFDVNLPVAQMRLDTLCPRNFAGQLTF